MNLGVFSEPEMLFIYRSVQIIAIMLAFLKAVVAYTMTINSWGGCGASDDYPEYRGLTYDDIAYHIKNDIK